MKQISVNALYPKWLIAKEKSKPCTVIDVREVEEYVQAHVPNAKLISLHTVAARSDEFPKEGAVYVVCRSGMRSSQAIEFLEQNYGHQNLVNVTGGTMAWIEGNYPIEQAL
ncbi:MAG: rhodanese-like domain-containing protein [Mariprofundaceae bacterium]|nr:rhodanese-like domain-containing protein [Mariprofundaceae bacterium]